MRNHWLDKWENEQDDKPVFIPKPVPVRSNAMRVTPVGPWGVTEDDEDDTYELFDLGMAKRYAGIPCCNVWVYCATKLRVKKNLSWENERYRT